MQKHLTKELAWLENRRRELDCEPAMTTEGEIERKAICKALGVSIRRIKNELRKKDKNVPAFCGGGLEAL